jgi:putative hydrolase of the HAD superfamily
MNDFRPNSQNDIAATPEEMNADTAILARRHAPVLLCDSREPFVPVALGVTRLAHGSQSPSCRHVPKGPDSCEIVLEYAIWWDGDIQHFYELEHVWVFLDAAGKPVHAAASAHGHLKDMGEAEWRDERIVLYCEPGKHAHAAKPADIIADRSRLDEACSSGKELRGVMVEEPFKEALAFLTPYDQFLGRQNLRARCFEPSYCFDKEYDLAPLPVLTWLELASFIPRFLRNQTEEFRAAYDGIKAVFLDSGDTMIDEVTQVFDTQEDELVLSADPIEGGDKLVAELKARGYLVALVADGREKSFLNVHDALGFWDLFDAKAISEVCDSLKPDARIFREAMFKLGLREEDTSGIVMVGNNITRDVKGANSLGMNSVWIDWNDRYPREPQDELEQADHVIRKPLELLPLLEQMEVTMRSGSN